MAQPHHPRLRPRERRRPAALAAFLAGRALRPSQAVRGAEGVQQAQGDTPHCQALPDTSHEPPQPGKHGPTTCDH
jgi:hypothetical protein